MLWCVKIRLVWRLNCIFEIWSFGLGRVASLIQFQYHRRHKSLSLYWLEQGFPLDRLAAAREGMKIQWNKVCLFSISGYIMCVFYSYTHANWSNLFNVLITTRTGAVSYNAGSLNNFISSGWVEMDDSVFDSWQRLLRSRRLSITQNSF